MLNLIRSLLIVYVCFSCIVVGKELLTECIKGNQTILSEYYIQNSTSDKSLQACTTFQSDQFQSNITLSENVDQISNITQLDLINLWYTFPLLITNNVSDISERCQSGTRIFLEGIKNNELWAIKMFDATAKLPSGILSGNVNQFGDYDECLSVSQAQYCLAEINLESVWQEPYLPLKDLVHSHFPFRGTFDDPRHRVPDFSSVRWGICLPSQCSADDLQTSLTGILGLDTRVRPSMCKQSNSQPLPWTFGDYFARAFFALLLLAVTTSSLAVQNKASFLTNSESKVARLVSAFSLQNNWKQLTSPLNIEDNKNEEHKDRNNNKQRRPEIRAVHGIRALSAIALLMCHKSIALMFNPYINRTRTMENFGEPWTVIARTAIVYTDSFMLISGLLNAYSLLEDLDLHGSIKFKDKLISRIFRITPNIVAIILFCTYILPNVTSGPLWPDVVEHHSELCKNYMWRNFFYVHNLFGFENMCLTHTHQVGIDMQLFLFTPLLVYIYSLNKKHGIITGIVIGVLSTILRYYVTIQQNLSHMIYYGNPIKQMFDTASLSYILPSHRATIYVIGVIMAYILKQSSVYNLTKTKATLWWIVALSFGAVSMLGPFRMATLGYVYNNVDAAIFGSLSPVWWGVCLSWVIFASNYGYAGWFGDFLSWRGFHVFTKFGYAFYLVQFPVFFYNIGAQKTADEFRPQAILHFSETSAVIMFSILLTLCVEMPFQKIKTILFNKRDCKSKNKVSNLKKE